MSHYIEKYSYKKAWYLRVRCLRDRQWARYCEAFHLNSNCELISFEHSQNYHKHSTPPMLEAFYGYIFQLFQGIDYTALFVMMLIESSMIPFPSEIPLLAIGINAAKGTMNPFLGLLISLIAIFIGASVNYLI